MKKLLSGLLLLSLLTPVLPASRTRGRVSHSGPRPTARRLPPPTNHVRATRPAPIPKGPQVLGAKKGGFTADLRLTKAKSRSGHRYAGNRQLAKAMTSNPGLRKRIEKRFGSDAYARVKSGRNPRGAEWDHATRQKDSLRLLSKAEHAKVTRQQRQQRGGRGGYAMYRGANTLHNRLIARLR